MCKVEEALFSGRQLGLSLGPTPSVIVALCTRQVTSKLKVSDKFKTEFEQALTTELVSKVSLSQAQLSELEARVISEVCACVR